LRKLVRSHFIKNWSQWTKKLELIIYYIIVLFESGSCTRNRFYTPHPPLKRDKKCRQKAELGFAKCNFQNLDKKYSAYGVRTKWLFLPSKKKPKWILPKVWVSLKGLYAITITLHIIQLCLPLSWNRSNTGLVIIVLSLFLHYRTSLKFFSIAFFEWFCNTSYLCITQNIIETEIEKQLKCF